MTERTHPNWSGYIVQRQLPAPGGQISYSVTRKSDGIGLGAFFSLEPGGDVDLAIVTDKVGQALRAVDLSQPANPPKIDP